METKHFTSEKPRSFRVCHCCLNENNVTEIGFKSKSNSISMIALCDNCLKDLQEFITAILKENKDI
jgi:hypothetical protein